MSKFNKPVILTWTLKNNNYMKSCIYIWHNIIYGKKLLKIMKLCQIFSPFIMWVVLCN